LLKNNRGITLMAVKIRLARVGKKHVPFHRIVAVDGRKKRDGECLEMLGTYDGLNSSIVSFDQERYAYWVSQGAIATDAVKKIYIQHKKSASAA